MQRRSFSLACLAAGAALSAPAAFAQSAGLREGTDYRRLPRPAPVDSAAGQIEVVEFFAYTCVHCFRFEPLMVAWSKKQPAQVVVRRAPVAFNAGFVPLQHLYYTLEAMGKVEAFHDKVFKAIHVEGQRLNSPETIQAWAEKQGLDGGQFRQTFASFAVSGKARRAAQLQDAYQVEGTPAVGLGGRYIIGGQGARTLEIADALIADLRKG